MPITPGQTIGGYHVLEKIGEGGMGAVYKAEQPAIHRTVVLKVLSASVADNANMLDRFKREVDIIARLEHPHILPVYDFGQHEGNPYIVMRFMGGGSLLDRLRARSLNREQALRCFEQIADALDYAHERNIIHRDLKPANILLDDPKGSNAYLADFGLAKTLEGAADLTATGSILGTPAYMSPEQARGEKLDHRSDIYSLAVMIYEALAGQLPFRSETAMGYIQKHLVETPPPITTLKPDLPAALDSVIGCALSKDKNARPARASEFVRTVREAISGSAATVGHASMAAPASTRAAVGAPTVRQSASGALTAPLPASPTAAPQASTAMWAVPVALMLIIGAVAVIAAVVGIGLVAFRDQLFGPTIAVYPVGDSPRVVLYDGNAVWVANALGNSVAQLQASGCDQSPDPCGQPFGTYPVDVLPIGLAYDGQSLWVASALHSTLTQLDPQSGQAVAEFKLPNVPSALLLAHGSLWTANQFANKVTQIGLDGTIIGDYPMEGGPAALADDGSTVWVANQTGGTVAQIDSSGNIIATVALNGQPSAITFDGVHLWVALSDKNEVAGLANGKIVNRVAVGAQPVALIVGGGSVWVANQGDSTVTRIDPATAKVIATITLPAKPFALAWASCGEACGDLWVVSESADTVMRVRLK